MQEVFNRRVLVGSLLEQYGGFEQASTAGWSRTMRQWWPTLTEDVTTVRSSARLLRPPIAWRYPLSSMRSPRVTKANTVSSLGKLTHCLKDALVSAVVEVSWCQDLLGWCQCGRVQQHGAEDGFFRLKVMGLNSRCVGQHVTTVWNGVYLMSTGSRSSILDFADSLISLLLER